MQSIPCLEDEIVDVVCGSHDKKHNAIAQGRCSERRWLDPPVVHAIHRVVRNQHDGCNIRAPAADHVWHGPDAL